MFAIATGMCAMEWAHAVQSPGQAQQVANPFATPWLVSTQSGQAESSANGGGESGAIVSSAVIPVREYLPVLSPAIMRVLKPEVSIWRPSEVLPRFEASRVAKLGAISSANVSAGANGAVGGNGSATSSSNGLTSIATDAAGRPIFIKKKYNVAKIGDRGIGGGVNFYSLDKEVLLGKELSEEVEQSSKLFTDPKINEYINRIGQNLVRNSDAQVAFTIKVIDNDEVNAFALPGGFFYVNTGLIMAADNEAELAGVMAHEIAHVAARHATKNQTKRDIWNIASIPLIFVGGPAAIAVRNIASLAVPMSFMKFSRDAEREADLLGIQYEYATGYDPSAMVNFFERLSAKEKHRKNFIARAFASHPMNDDRVRRAQKEMDTMLPPNEEYLLTTSEFDEVKARLVKLTSYKKLEDFDPKHPTLRKSTSGDSDKSDKDDDRPTLKRR